MKAEDFPAWSGVAKVRRHGERAGRGRGEEEHSSTTATTHTFTSFFFSSSSSPQLACALLATALPQLAQLSEADGHGGSHTATAGAAVPQRTVGEDLALIADDTLALQTASALIKAALKVADEDSAPYDMPKVLRADLTWQRIAHDEAAQRLRAIENHRIVLAGANRHRARLARLPSDTPPGYAMNSPTSLYLDESKWRRLFVDEAAKHDADEAAAHDAAVAAARDAICSVPGRGRPFASSCHVSSRAPFSAASMSSWRVSMMFTPRPQSSAVYSAFVTSDDVSAHAGAAAAPAATSHVSMRAPTSAAGGPAVSRKSCHGPISSARESASRSVSPGIAVSAPCLVAPSGSAAPSLPSPAPDSVAVAALASAALAATSSPARASVHSGTPRIVSPFSPSGVVGSVHPLVFHGVQTGIAQAAPASNSAGFLELLEAGRRTLESESQQVQARLISVEARELAMLEREAAHQRLASCAAEERSRIVARSRELEDSFRVFVSAVIAMEAWEAVFAERAAAFSASAVELDARDAALHVRDAVLRRREALREAPLLAPAAPSPAGDARAGHSHSSLARLLARISALPHAGIAAQPAAAPHPLRAEPAAAAGSTVAQ